MGTGFASGRGAVPSLRQLGEVMIGAKPPGWLRPVISTKSPGFGWFVLVMGIYILVKELYLTPAIPVAAIGH